MTKRKGLFDIDVDVKKLLAEYPNTQSAASKTELKSLPIQK
ncbi:hypothetical protein [Bacillus cereus]|nr:hypothetical protein [Bacillus cereus]